MDTFSLDGLETTSMGEEAAAAAPAGEVPSASAEPAPPTPSAAAPADASEAPLDLDLGSLGAPEPVAPVAESRPEPGPLSAETAPASGADIPMLDLEMPSAGEHPSPSSPQGEQQQTEPAPAPPEPAPVPDLSLEMAATPSSAGDAGALPEEASAAPAAPAAAPAPPSAPAAEAEPASHEDPFVTETMAELYLRQGHRDEALRVYEALAAQRPDDATLREKVTQLKQPTPTDVAPAAAAPASPPASGPTIGSVLNFIALRRPGYKPEPLAGNGASAKEAAPTQEQTPSAPAPLAAASSEPSASSPASHIEMTDTLSPALGFPTPSDADERAALALAGVFMSNGRSHSEGTPARVAGSELTLDSVFRGGGENAEATDAPRAQRFSFDQFFSQRASAEFAAGGAEQGEQTSAAESQADVAQFTQWLEGLKRR